MYIVWNENSFEILYEYKDSTKLEIPTQSGPKKTLTFEPVTQYRVYLCLCKVWKWLSKNWSLHCVYKVKLYGLVSVPELVSRQGCGVIIKCSLPLMIILPSLVMASALHVIFGTTCRLSSCFFFKMSHILISSYCDVTISWEHPLKINNKFISKGLISTPLFIFIV